MPWLVAHKICQQQRGLPCNNHGPSLMNGFTGYYSAHNRQPALQCLRPQPLGRRCGPRGVALFCFLGSSADPPTPQKQAPEYCCTGTGRGSSGHERWRGFSTARFLGVRRKPSSPPVHAGREEGSVAPVCRRQRPRPRPLRSGVGWFSDLASYVRSFVCLFFCVERSLFFFWQMWRDHCWFVSLPQRLASFSFGMLLKRRSRSWRRWVSFFCFPVTDFLIFAFARWCWRWPSLTRWMDGCIDR